MRELHAVDTGMCTSCRNAIELANARKADEERKKRQAQQPQPRSESQTIRYTANGYFKKKWYRNGDLYSGTMKDGYRHGKEKWTRATDKFTYDGDCYMSKRHGHGQEEMPGQWRFEGEFYDNKRNGFGKLVSTGGESYEGEWVNGNHHGKGTYYNAARNETHDGEWKDDKLNGYVVVRYGDGRIYEGYFADNVKTGSGKQTAPDGTVKALGKYNGSGLSFPDIVAAACFSLGTIITLDKNGFLHGDMSGVDINDFMKDFQW